MEQSKGKNIRGKDVSSVLADLKVCDKDDYASCDTYSKKSTPGCTQVDEGGFALYNILQIGS
jgi:hypothetical protein